MWPDLFSTTTVLLFGNGYELPLITMLYGVLLVYLEVNMLVALNLHGVKTIMRICQFPHAHDAQYDRHLQALADAALEKTNKGILRFGIDPYLNMPRWGLTIYFLLNIDESSVEQLSSQIFIETIYWPLHASSDH